MSEQFNFNIDMRQMQQKMQSHLRQHWKLFAAEGVFLIILGTTAIIIPQIFTVGIALFLGWLLLIAGIAQVIRAISVISMPGFSLWLFTGLLQVIIGYFLVTDTLGRCHNVNTSAHRFIRIGRHCKNLFTFFNAPFGPLEWNAF